jgi:hypothetical protein
MINSLVSRKTLVNQEKFQNPVATLTELADARCGEADRTRDIIAQYRKEIETRDQEIERKSLSFHTSS